jgi:hypothetical protein
MATIIDLARVDTLLPFLAPHDYDEEARRRGPGAAPEQQQDA